MAVYGATRVAKWILVILNVLVLCAGAVAIGLGAWGLASEYGAETLKDLTGSQLYRGAAIAIIVGGSVLCVISLCGLIGAIVESKWLLGIYFVIMLLLLILFVTAAAVGFAFRDKIEEELSKQMEKSLINQYGVQINDNDDNYRVTQVWDKIQDKLDCCGVKGGLTDTKSWFLWQSSKWFDDKSVSAGNFVPASCCVSKTSNFTCQKPNVILNRPIQILTANVNEENPALNSKGCIDKIEDSIRQHIIAIVGIAVAILVVMLFAIILSVCVCTNIQRSKKSEDQRL